jgi:hypothetical protein
METKLSDFLGHLKYFNIFPKILEIVFDTLKEKIYKNFLKSNKYRSKYCSVTALL